MGVNSLPKTVTRQRRDCDLNPGPSAPESSTLTTRLPSYSPLNLPPHYTLVYSSFISSAENNVHYRSQRQLSLGAVRRWRQGVQHATFSGCKTRSSFSEREIIANYGKS